MLFLWIFRIKVGLLEIQTRFYSFLIDLWVKKINTHHISMFTRYSTLNKSIPHQQAEKLKSLSPSIHCDLSFVHSVLLGLFRAFLDFEADRWMKLENNQEWRIMFLCWWWCVKSMGIANYLTLVKKSFHASYSCFFVKSIIMRIFRLKFVENLRIQYKRFEAQL